MLGTVDAGAHVLQVAETERAQRAATSAWLDHHLAFGAKVYYKGWLAEDGRSQHWLAGPGATVRTRRALSTGQLEFTDFPRVIERCGGTSEGLFDLQREELGRGLAEGYTSVAMTQESTGRELARLPEIVEFAHQESGYDALVREHPLDVLCQLTAGAENVVHVVESMGVHHRELVDSGWAASTVDGRWTLRGDLDSRVAQRFGGALTGALQRSATRTDGAADLHVDMGAVEFVDVACAQLMVLTARGAASGQQLVVHSPPRLLRRMLDALERPATIVYAPGEGPR